MGGDWRPAGRGQEAARTRRDETKRKSRAAACGTPGRAQKGAPPTPAIDGRPTNTPPRGARRPHQPPGHDPMTMIRIRGSKRTVALSARPPAVRRACADVLSRRTAKKAAGGCAARTKRRAIPAAACRRQRALISPALIFRGRRGGVQPLRKGYGRSQTRLGPSVRGRLSPLRTSPRMRPSNRERMLVAPPKPR